MPSENQDNQNSKSKVTKKTKDVENMLKCNLSSIILREGINKYDLK